MIDYTNCRGATVTELRDTLRTGHNQAATDELNARYARYCMEVGGAAGTFTAWLTTTMLDEQVSAAATCEWYLLCSNPATGTVRHPGLGEVPTCDRCAAKHDLDLRRFDG